MIRSTFGTMIVLSILFSSFAIFADDTFDGNKAKGKWQLRKLYRKCKKGGEVDSETPPVSPADKKMAEWKTIYTLITADKVEKKEDQEKLTAVMKELKCEKEWKALKKKTLKNIFTYMYKHAEDSKTPAKCK